MFGLGHMYESIRIISLYDDTPFSTILEDVLAEQHTVAGEKQGPIAPHDDEAIRTASEHVPIEYITAERSTQQSITADVPADDATALVASNTPGDYNADEYKNSLDETLKVLPDVKTACHSHRSFSGLNNQIYNFFGACFAANSENFGQIIEQSITWKDTFGTNHQVPHRKLWDVVHWNSFFPNLPRFASYDKDHHPDLDLIQTTVTIEGKAYPKLKVKYNAPWDIWTNRSITRPQPLIQYPQQGQNLYKGLTRAIYFGRVHRKEERKQHLIMYKEMLKGALRPHPFLQGIIEKARMQLKAGGKYMTLHARVEPDMAKQDRVCSVSHHSSP